MRVVFFVGEFNEGGAERVISILANKMIEKGFDIEILKYHNTENLYEVNDLVYITSVEENTKTRDDILTNLKWMRKHFKDNADIIVSFLAPFNILAILSNIGNKTPIIVADRNDPRFVPSNKLIRLIRDNLYKLANGIVVQTKHNKEYFSKHVQKKTVVISNPIDIGENKGLALRTDKEDLIVSVGRLKPQKNQKMLIKAFSEVHKLHPEYKLVIYGEGTYREELKNYISELKLTNSISLPGNDKDIDRKMAKARIYVSSSNYEGMSNSLIEAMCIGLPVITTKVSGTEELIENNINGITIDIGDVKSLEENILDLIDNKEKRTRLGKEATKVTDNLNTDLIVDKWINLINSIINK